MTRTLDAFPNKFWGVDSRKHTGRPESVLQALVEISGDQWEVMIETIYLDYDIDDVSIEDVMTLIRETNTCGGLDSELDVWIDEAGDFKIKVYYV